MPHVVRSSRGFSGIRGDDALAPRGVLTEFMTNSGVSHVDRDREAVRRIVRGINDHWRAKRYDQIGARLAEAVVVAPPGTMHVEPAAG